MQKKRKVIDYSDMIPDTFDTQPNKSSEEMPENCSIGHDTEKIHVEAIGLEHPIKNLIVCANTVQRVNDSIHVKISNSSTNRR